MIMMKVISNLLVLHFYVSSIGRLSHHLITSQLPNVHMYFLISNYFIGLQNSCCGRGNVLAVMILSIIIYDLNYSRIGERRKRQQTG
jgi:hypothetical protein